MPMPTVQVIPPANGPYTLEAFGRTFKTTAGVPITVTDNEAGILMANGWILAAEGGHGTTAQRPVKPPIGTRYTDTTVGYLVLWDGKTWRKCIDGGAV